MNSFFGCDVVNVKKSSKNARRILSTQKKQALAEVPIKSKIFSKKEMERPAEYFLEDTPVSSDSNFQEELMSLNDIVEIHL